MDMTTDMLAPEDVLAPKKATADTLLPALPTLSPEKYAAAVYKPFKDRLAAAIDSVKSINYDITTTAGMQVATKARALFRDLRVEANNERETRKGPIIKIGKLLESSFNDIKASITPLEELFDADIQAEAARKAKVKRINEERIASIKAAIEEIRMRPARAVGSTSTELRTMLEQAAVEVATNEVFAEFIEDAQIAMDAAGQELVGMFGAAQQREVAAAEAEAARVAEVARLAAEQAAADRRRADDAAENARVAAENAATAQRLADQQAAIDRAAAEVKAQLEAVKAVAAKVAADAEAAERQRQADEDERAANHQAATARAERERQAAVDAVDQRTTSAAAGNVAADARAAALADQGRLADLANEQAALAPADEPAMTESSGNPLVGGQLGRPLDEQMRRSAAAVVWSEAKAEETPATPPTLRLGQINERIAPLAISADGLLSLGFAPAATDKAAKLYHEADFPRICAAMQRHIDAVRVKYAA